MFFEIIYLSAKREATVTRFVTNAVVAELADAQA
jgi:hypothetical protein